MGFHLLFDQFPSIQHRIDIGGVAQVGDAPGYDDKTAVVPTGDWRPLTRDEAEQFRVDETTPPGLVVELVSRILRVSPGADLDARRQAAAALDPVDGRWPREFLACADSPAGCLTTTQDFDNDCRRIGLHIDNFDRLPYSARLRSRRRLCLNFGPGTRYLLVGDLSILEMCQVVGRDQHDYRPNTDDLRRYVSEGNPLRCLRIRLDPGEGYIAPTELLPHDGSTAGAAEWSVAAFWLETPPTN
ncbi:hypothetical protein AB0C10_16125 [Microbispora amethystogenes]|uniref:hypothetical protein n=1 Tax=Microbispora amethystogenes TaxID=1427754 RepID=UPI0033D45BFD